MEELARAVAAEAPAALADIYSDLQGLPRPPTIEIRLVRAADDLPRVAPPGARVPSWAVGVAFPRVGVVAVAARQGAQAISVPSTVRHELAHLAVGAALSGYAPRWLDEGFAFLHSAEFSLARAQTLTGLAWSRDRYRLAELTHSFPPGERGADKAYAQAYDFVAYVAKRGRYADSDDDGDRAAFREFLNLVATGRGVNPAALTAFGVPIDELEDEWWRGLRDRYLWSLVGLSSLLIWVVGAVLLVLGWWRRRRDNRRRLRIWEREEAAVDPSHGHSHDHSHGPEAPRVLH
jgi:hypothetical protein